jgi:cytochrome c-type biogenesis protein CcmF
VIIGGALALFALRAPQLRKGEIFDVVSRESLLLTGNMILMAATSAVMLGTLYPLILDALDLGKISVGPPYFDSVFVPIMSPAILLIGFAIFSKWKKDEISNIAKKLGWCFILSLSGSILIPLMLGSFKPMTSLGLLMSFWIISTSTLHLYKQIKGTKKDSLRSLLGLPRPYIGMMMGHLGLAIFITGVTMVKSYESNVDTSLSIGNQISVGQYTFHFDAVKMIEGPNYIASRGYFSVTKANSSDLIKLFPERREYKAQKSQLTEAAINPGLFRDLYVSMAEQINPTTWAIRVYVKPFANWIWFGCFMMAIGACLSFSDKKYQTRKEG